MLESGAPLSSFLEEVLYKYLNECMYYSACHPSDALACVSSKSAIVEEVESAIFKSDTAEYGKVTIGRLYM